jgi:hypothetical protein
VTPRLLFFIESEKVSVIMSSILVRASAENNQEARSSSTREFAHNPKRGERRTEL